MTLFRRIRQARTRLQSARFAAAQTPTPLHDDDPLSGGEIEHWAEILTPPSVPDPTARAVLAHALRWHADVRWVEGLFAAVEGEFEHV